MALNLYLGLPRSGKSYEVVSNVILPAIEQGRDVVSNIAGLNEQAIYDLLVEEGKDPVNFGRVKFVTEEQILSANFFRTDKMSALDESYIQPGDLVALDEIWRFWPGDQRVSKDHMNFFRMHGHMVHAESGLTCEIVLITQDLNDVHRSIKGVIQQTLFFEKKTELGLENQYTIEIYQRTNIRKAPTSMLGPYTYKKKYFPLYTSHSMNSAGVKPREERVEKRGSIFSSRLMKFGMPLALVMFISGIYFAVDFFDPDSNRNIAGVAVEHDDATIGKPVSIIPAGIPAAGTQTTSAAPSKVSTTWRVAGHFTNGGISKVMLVSQDGRSRLLIPAVFVKFGNDYQATIHDQEFNSWDLNSGMKSFLP